MAVNADLQLFPVLHGPLSGTIQVQNEYGIWNGTWVGILRPDGLFIRAVLKGEGAYKGLHAKATYVRRSTDPTVYRQLVFRFPHNHTSLRAK